FSSRRRHTRFSRDWSSDVCSSDLGYYPMSSWLRIRPGTVTPAAMIDGSAHRKGLPPIYNQYLNAAADPLYERETEDRQMLFRPRSEERRVGKECRSRGAANERKNK